MTKNEALRLALEALTNAYWPTDSDFLPAHNIKECAEAITAIKAALEAKDEPVKLRRGDILRCIETDELCTVWATSTSGKTLVKWKGNDFGSYTAEQIGELFWLEPKAKDEPVDLNYQPDWKEEYQKAVDLHCITLDELREANAWIKNVEKLMADQDKILESQTARIVELQEHIENFDGEDR